jgi:hypothetical protein
LLTGALLTTGVVFATGALAGVLEAATFEAVAFATVAFAAVLAVLFGIALLLFFEDLAAEALLTGVLLTAVLAAFRGSLTEVRTRPFVALRLTADAFREPLEILFLRVFCDTACAWRIATPLFEVFTGTQGKPIKRAQQGPASSIVLIIAHFPQKSMIYALSRPLHKGRAGHILGLGLSPTIIPPTKLLASFSRQYRVREKNISQTSLPCRRNPWRRPGLPFSG